MSALAEGWSWSGWSEVGRGWLGVRAMSWLVGRWSERVEACGR